MRNAWRNLSISNKLYVVMGTMVLLITIELMTLRFAMNTLSSLRAFVTGEALWSKAQKEAVLSLHQYATTRNPLYYERFQNFLKVPMGDRIARLELLKQDPNYAEIKRGFLLGRIDENDIPGLTQLVLRFNNNYHLKKALGLWAEGDVLASELQNYGERLHGLVLNQASSAEFGAVLKQIDSVNERLTTIEDNFSYTLGEGSRWLEETLLITLFLAVILIESTGLLITYRLSRNLTSRLKEMNVAAKKVGAGDFQARLVPDSTDEVGQLTIALNQMIIDIEKNIGQRQVAENASRLKSLFLANMSHEIRTPLGAIMGFSQLLCEPTATEEERLKYVKIIQRTGENLNKIVNDILDLSKVEAGYFEVEKRNFLLSNMLTEIKAVLDSRWSHKQIQLSIEKVGDVPNLIFTDAVRLQQILLNLLGNAMKFTENGEVKLTYQVVGSQLAFSIEDNGPGLTQEQRKALFQAFSQVDSSPTRKFEGVGLGLVLSRRLAQLLGGDVVLKESEPGIGSTFVATISYGVEDSLNPFSYVPATKGDKAPADLSGKSALVVDDSIDNRLLISKILTRQKINVQVAENGLEAMKLALANPFDYILMDIQMPVMDGYEATRKLRESGYKRPIIAITAHAMKEDRRKCLDAGCDEYLSKPIQFTSLIETLNAFASA